MSQEFINRFYPRIINVLPRDRDFWQTNHYEVFKPTVQINNTGYVSSGTGRMELNGTAHPLTKGTWFHFRPGDHMKMVSSPSDPLNYISIHYDFKLLHWEGSDLHFRDPKEGLPFINALKIADETSFELEYADALNIWEEKMGGYEWKIRTMLTRVFNEVFKEESLRQRGGADAVLTMNSVLNHINTYYVTPLNRGEMAKKVSLSASYFSVLFKKHTGHTYLNYIHKVRLDKAKILLRNESLSISEVARGVGFEDPLYFSRLFSKEIGLSPREYRRA